jgi:hypothetical protein
MQQKRRPLSFVLESLFARWGSYDKLYDFNSNSPNVRVKVGRKQRKQNPCGGNA